MGDDEIRNSNTEIRNETLNFNFLNFFDVGFGRYYLFRASNFVLLILN